MGNSLTHTQRQHAKELQFLLKLSGHKIGERPLTELLLAIDLSCPWYPETGSFRLSDWEKIGFQLHTEPRAPVKTLHTWHLCWDAVQKLANPLVHPPPANIPSASLIAPSYPPPDPLTKPCLLLCRLRQYPQTQTHCLPPLSAMQKIVAEAHQQGDTEIIRATTQAGILPVVRQGANQLPQWPRLAFNYYK